MAFDKNDHSAQPRPIGRFKQSANDVKVIDCPGGMQVYIGIEAYFLNWIIITFYIICDAILRAERRHSQHERQEKLGDARMVSARKLFRPSCFQVSSCCI